MGFGTVATSINLIATTLTMRCRGMSLGRMPLYVWMMLVVSGMTVLALPPLSAAQIMLLLDRFLGATSSTPRPGLRGHVAALLLVLRPPRGLHPHGPGVRHVSEIIPVFSRKVIFGYPMVVAASIAIASWR